MSNVTDLKNGVHEKEPVPAPDADEGDEVEEEGVPGNPSTGELADVCLFFQPIAELC